MALELKTDIKPTALGASLAFKDITGTTSSTGYSQGGNIGYASVTAIRLKTSTYLSMLSPATLNSGAFTQYKEYQLVGAPCVVDSKIFSTGAILYHKVQAYLLFLNGKKRDSMSFLILGYLLLLK